MTNMYWDRDVTEICYEPPELATVEHRNFDIFVVDDFLAEPEAVRAQMLGLDFQTPPNPKRVAGFVRADRHRR